MSIISSIVGRNVGRAIPFLSVVLSACEISDIIAGVSMHDDELLKQPNVPQAFHRRPIDVADWLQTDGRYIYYRYGARSPNGTRYFGVGCSEEVQAVGSWADAGWAHFLGIGLIGGITVECLKGGWLRFDATRLKNRVRLGDPECFNFVDRDYEPSNPSAATWGMHSRLGAPGTRPQDPDYIAVRNKGDYDAAFVLRFAGGDAVVTLTNVRSSDGEVATLCAPLDTVVVDVRVNNSDSAAVNVINGSSFTFDWTSLGGTACMFTSPVAQSGVALQGSSSPIAPGNSFYPVVGIPLVITVTCTNGVVNGSDDVLVRLVPG